MCLDIKLIVCVCEDASQMKKDEIKPKCKETVSYFVNGNKVSQLLMSPPQLY